MVNTVNNFKKKLKNCKNCKNKKKEISLPPLTIIYREPPDSVSGSVSVRKIIALMSGLLQLQCFSAAFAIGGVFLHDKSVQRVMTLFESALSADETRQLENVLDLQRNDFARYKVRAVVPPAVLPLHCDLAEIGALEERNTAQKQSNEGLINFHLYREVGRRVRRVQMYQQTPYNLKPLPRIAAMLDAQISAAKKLSDEQAWRKAMHIKPGVNRTRAKNILNQK